FVAQLSGAHLGQLRALPFVHWVGEYRPELKVFGSLRKHLEPGAAANSIPISVLVASGASLPQLGTAGSAAVGRKALRVQSRSSFGTIARAEVTPTELATLARSDAVLWIEPAPRMRLSDEISSKIVGGGEVPDAPTDGTGDPTDDG